MTRIQLDKRLVVPLYILAFILLREWLLPMMELTDTDYLWVFLLFIALSFLLPLARVKWWIVAPIKMIYIIWVIHYIYLEKVFFSIESVQFVMSDMIKNLSIVRKMEWDHLSNSFNTMLFFLLLWMTTYLIRYWINVKKSIFLFYLLTVIFIAILDTFSSYSADESIFRIMVVGLLLLGLLQMAKLTNENNKNTRPGNAIAISLPLLFMLTVSGAMAMFLPKQESVWADPVPYFQSIVQGTGIGGNSVSKSGYDSDDSSLGGSFIKDNTVVFEVKVPSKQYWKIETKNTYTTKGWEQVSSNEERQIYIPGLEFGVGAERRTGVEKATFQVMEPFPFLLYPYGISGVYAIKDSIFYHSFSTGKYTPTLYDDEVSLASYEIEFKEPEYSLTLLKSSKIQDYANESEDFTSYLHLPQQLPQRVRELAEEITIASESVYEKAKSIENYFKNNGFVYTQQNVAVPKGDEDYVDQFLFDTKSGYCDNFSTSMVVMLRTLGIPARWVKGFVSGDSSINDEGERVFQITNNEAHSWVEAYLPGVGWMPFEPTIGFSGQTQINYDLEVTPAEPEMPELKEPEQPKSEPVEEQKREKKKRSISYFEPMTNWMKNSKWVMLVGLVVLVLSAWRLFVTRLKWMSRILIRRNRSSEKNWTTFDKQYTSLLKQLSRFGLKRANGVTLSDYAYIVDDYFGGDSMRTLTAAYEKGVYGGNTIDHDWISLQEVWEDLINRSSSR